MKMNDLGPWEFHIAAALRLIKILFCKAEPLRAPRAALGQPKSSQELPEQPLACQGPPRGHFPNLIEKPYESCETSLKKSKKHRARAPPDQFLLLFVPKTLQNVRASGSTGSRGSGPRTACRNLSSSRAGGQDDGTF